MKAAIVLVLLAIVATMITLDLFEDLKNDVEYLVATLVCVLVIVVGIVITVRIQYSRLRNALPRLRKKYPVSYFCSWELSGDVNFITSDSKHIKIWALKKNEFVEQMAVERAAVRLEKGEVKVAVLRKSTGLILVSKEDPRARVPVNVCKDDLNPMLPALKGEQLDTAIRRLQRGK